MHIRILHWSKITYGYVSRKQARTWAAKLGSTNVAFSLANNRVKGTNYADSDLFTDKQLQRKGDNLCIFILLEPTTTGMSEQQREPGQSLDLSEAKCIIIIRNHLTDPNLPL